MTVESRAIVADTVGLHRPPGPRYLRGSMFSPDPVHGSPLGTRLLVAVVVVVVRVVEAIVP
jgi:hypothetical protein